MHVETKQIAITTNADGDFTGYTSVGTGRILEIRLVVPGSGGLEATTDLTITNETTGAAILSKTDQNGSATWCPRQATHGATGTAATYDGTRAVLDACYVANHRVKCVVAQGGNATTGTLHVTIG